MKSKRHLLMTGVLLAVLTFQAAAENGDAAKAWLRGLIPGKPVIVDALTVIPLRTSGISGPASYVTLEKALQENWLTITEHEGGNVPEVLIRNLSDKRIFIMGGEILTGCKQDRIVARDVLIRPKAKSVLVPVYCVEAGRWNAVSGKFFSEKNLGSYELRATAQDSSSGAQSTIWNKVAKSNAEKGIASDTSAYQDAYRDEGVRASIDGIVEKMEKAFRLDPSVIGVLIGVGDVIVSLDVFSDPGLFEEMWPKILKSAAFSAVGSGTNTGVPAAEEFIEQLAASRFDLQDGVDLGTELVFDGETLSVHALSYQSDVIHLAAFPVDKTDFHAEGTIRRQYRQPAVQSANTVQSADMVQSADNVQRFER